MILVTGAAGKTGRAILGALTASHASVRALVRRPDQAASVQRLGATDIVAGDMRDASVMRQATAGVRAVYHICPNMHPEELAIGREVIAASRSNGVANFVYHSVLHPQTEAMPHHWQKLRVEELLFESGLKYTIIQPAAYMQNTLGQWDRIVTEGVYAVPYAIDTQLGMVDLEDVAAAVSAVLTGGSHQGATYELAGSEILTQGDVAEVLGQRLGRPVQAQAMPLAKWRDQAAQSGLREYQLETLCAMFRYYEAHGFWGNSNVLTWLLGRPPTSFAAFVDRVAQNRSGSQPDDKPI